MDFMLTLRESNFVLVYKALDYYINHNPGLSDANKMIIKHIRSQFNVAINEYRGHTALVLIEDI